MSDSLDRNETRSEVRKILQLMNQYELLEFEYEDKKGDTSIELSRSSTDSFPPLLEGRSEAVPGKLRAPAVGRLRWEVDAGSTVEQGELLAVVEHHEERTDVPAATSGVLVESAEDSHVEYGEHIGSIVPEASLDESNEDENDPHEDSDTEGNAGDGEE